jgi:hypothetical protein
MRCAFAATAWTLAAWLSGAAHPASQSVALQVPAPFVTNAGADSAGRGDRSLRTPKELLRSTGTYRDVPLRLAAFASRIAGDGALKITVIVEIAGAAKASAAAIGVFDATHTLAEQWSSDSIAAPGQTVVATFTQNPGRYRIRCAVIDAAGKRGTIDDEFTAALTPAGGGLTLSTMMLGVTNKSFAPKLQFGGDDQAVAYFELYGGRRGMPVSVVVELAETLDGPAISGLHPSITASPEPDKHIITTPIALGALAPGDYVVRATVGLDGQPAGRIVRTLRKTR